MRTPLSPLLRSLPYYLIFVVMYYLCPRCSVCIFNILSQCLFVVPFGLGTPGVFLGACATPPVIMFVFYLIPLCSFPCCPPGLPFYRPTRFRAVKSRRPFCFSKLYKAFPFRWASLGFPKTSDAVGHSAPLKTTVSVTAASPLLRAAAAVSRSAHRISA